MVKVGQITAIIVMGIIMLPVTKNILDTFFDNVVADLPGLNAVESLVISSYPYAIGLTMIIAIFVVIKRPGGGPGRRM